MNTITFNKNYTKLPAGIKTAVLVAVEPVRGAHQVPIFIQYDTDYKLTYDPFCTYERELFGDYLCLVLKSDTGAIFTTLRKDNVENREKYMKINNDWKYRQGKETMWRDYEFWQPNYGKEFEIIIKEG